jgi:antitoxin YefM
MSTTFRLNADELENSFVGKIKTLFAHKDIAVTIYEEDETDYLSSARANREHLDSAIADIQEGKNLVEVDPKIFE